MYNKGVIFIMLTMGLTGCLPVRPNFNPPQITQLQARAIQSRTYEGMDQKTVLKTIFNVLQDEGFIVRYGDSELGLLNASKELVELDKTNFSGRFSNSLSNTNGYPNAISIIEATANISEFGKRVKVRLNFQRKVYIEESGGFFSRISDNVSVFGASGGSVKTIDVTQINDPKYYQEFFVKVDKGLFIQRQGL